MFLSINVAGADETHERYHPSGPSLELLELFFSPTIPNEIE
jgi:hypothetical protein